MGQQLIYKNGILTVIDVGPPGPPGRRGPAGSGGGGGSDAVARGGFEFVTPTTGSGFYAGYQVVTVGSSNAETYFVSLSGATPKVIVVDSTADAATAQSFRLVMALDDILTVGEINLLVPGLGIFPYGFWGSAYSTTMTVELSCLPEVLFGTGSDIWYPANAPVIMPRAGAYFVAASSEAGDGITDPDCSADLHLYAANASTITVDVAGYSFIDLNIAFNNERLHRPYRLELTNAASITTVRLSHPENETVTDFDPTALGLFNGTAIVSTVQLVNRGSGSFFVLDPVY